MSPFYKLPSTTSKWKFDRVDGGTEFGVTVTATVVDGYGDTFAFEVNSLDPSCEQGARGAGFPEPVIAAALELMNWSPS